MIETEWKVVCANGHRTYQRIWMVRPDDIEFELCPDCGAPRWGALLPPVRGTS